MAQRIGQITNADLYFNGTDVRGQVVELDMGEIAHQDIEHATLGMIGILKLPGRPVQAIEGKIVFDWLDETIEKDLLNPTKIHKIQLHSYVDGFDHQGLSAEKSHTLVTHLSFSTMKRSSTTSKLGEQMGSEYEICIHSFVQKVYGSQTPIIEFDVFNSIYNVNGEAVWPS